MSRRQAFPYPFERPTFMPMDAFGLDSIQGYLELALIYPRRQVILVCDSTDKENFHSMYSQLSRMEKEGHLILEWSPRNSEEGYEKWELKQIALTTSGHKLLGELRAKSKLGKIKERLSTILWSAASSVVTTLVVLAVKGS